MFQDTKAEKQGKNKVSVGQKKYVVIEGKQREKGDVLETLREGKDK